MDQIQAYRGFSIKLPTDHMLLIHQEQHKKYDRFLPHLSKYLEPNSTVIDVGANCGDTLAGMISENQKLHYICIEPDSKFFEYLEANILCVKKAYKNAIISAVKALVGRDIKTASLEGTSGTKHAVVNSSGGTLRSRSLDDILSNIECPRASLLKSDVDGFDYDVINSAEKMLNTQHPIVFFECQYESERQKAEYEKVIGSLQSFGYDNWTIFDNFGEIVLRTNDIQNVFQLMGYVWNQNIAATTRTIYYYDILAATKNDAHLIDRVVSQYQSR